MESSSINVGKALYYKCTARTSPRSILAAREREVLQLLSEGKAVKEITSFLQVSVKTVETHRMRIMNKLSIHSTAELTKYAIREGLTSLNLCPLIDKATRLSAAVVRHPFPDI
ncbi:response regulator transcription factor [Chloroflexota bacterium]